MLNDKKVYGQMVLEILSIIQVTCGLGCKPNTGSLSGNVLKSYMGQLQDHWDVSQLGSQPKVPPYI